MSKHRCKMADKFGAEYFYSNFFKSWTEKYDESTSAGALQIMLTAFYCKFCGDELK